MPRYFFHVRDGSSDVDEDGVELPDILSAKAEAIRLSGSLLRELGADFWERGEWKLEVYSSENELLFALVLTAAENERSFEA